jgi:hypothetical protein
MAMTPNPRHLPIRTLRAHDVPCVAWFEDAIGFYGVSTVVFDLYILVPDIDAAAQVLVQNGWTLVTHTKGKIGNAFVDDPQRRLEPPASFDPLPPPHMRLPQPTTTVLLPAADWHFPISEISADGIEAVAGTVFPPLARLTDALIDTLLDCPDDNHTLQTHLGVYITALYCDVLEPKGKAYAEELRYEHRQYHFDVLAGMDHATVPFVVHQRRVREALRQGTWELRECSADRDNEDLFSKKVQARILAAMPNPLAGMERDLEDENGGWGPYESSEEDERMLDSCTKPHESEADQQAVNLKSSAV